MTQRGAYARRNAGHRERRARLFAAAPDDAARLVAAFDWFRSSAALLARRRTPKGVPQSAHADVAVRLVREATAHLKAVAEAIDRGDHDAK
jgi:hypothetical protein